MTKVIFFSGSGINAESGIPTFRDAGGLWENHKVEDICSVTSLKRNKEQTINFYDNLRVQLQTKQPNKTHKAIQKLQKKYPNDIAIITQNVDDLFEKAGCKDVLHVHGFLPSIYCSLCDFETNIGYQKQNSVYSSCPQCKNKTLRPNIVFFGEMAPMYANLYKELEDCEFLVVIGSSGHVLNTDMFLNKKIKYSILNNLEASDVLDATKYSKVLYKKATQAIDEIVKDVEEFLNKTK